MALQARKLSFKLDVQLCFGGCFAAYASWFPPVSIFDEPQQKHHVGIITHQLARTATENTFWRQLIGVEGALEWSGSLPPRSEMGRSEEPNVAVTLDMS